MGSSQSQSKNISKQPQQLITINHPRFSNVKFISNPTEDDQGIMQITIALPNQTEFKKWNKKVIQIGQFDYIFLPISQTFLKTEFCGSGGFSTIRFPYYPYLLSDEIRNRCTLETKFFEQPELWYLIYSILLAGSTFHSKNLKIGDVRPENIFISPEGQVRIATQFTWPGEQTNYQKALFQKQTCYLSPEELRDIGYGKLDESGSFSETQSFSVGLTCLDAATLSNSRQLYLQNHKFNFTKLEERLRQLENSKNFSEPLILIIKGLCQVEAEKRANCRELAQWLEKYQEYIIQLQNFTVQQLPVSLQNLRFQKPKDSRVMRQSNTYAQPNSQQVPTTQSNIYLQSTNNQVSILPESNYSKSQQQNIAPVSQLTSVPQYVSQPKYDYMPQNPSYIVLNPVQSSYDKNYEQSGYLGQVVTSNYVSNNVFSKYANSRSGASENSQSINPPVGPPKANLNLQQIDEQLNISRRMFPSS